MTQKTSTSKPLELPEIFSFNIDHLLALPCHVYWKDRKSVYLGYNDYGAARLGFHKGKDIVGHSDLELFPHTIATDFKKNDQEAIAQKKQIFIHENGVLKKDLKVTFFSYKIPLFNKKKL